MLSVCGLHWTGLAPEHHPTRGRSCSFPGCLVTSAGVQTSGLHLQRQALALTPSSHAVEVGG